MLQAAAATDYLATELQRLDALLHREILRLRASYHLSLDEFRGLYVSDQQVDNFVRENAGEPADTDALSARAEALHAASLAFREPGCQWERLGRSFQLEDFELDVVLLALAVELHPKYETIYAYLNNDVTRKWPTFDLALRLFAGDPHRFLARRFLVPQSRLFAGGVLRPASPGADRTSWLSSGFTIAPEVSRFLLALPPEGGHLNEFVRRMQPRARWSELPLTESLRSQLSKVPDVFFTACPNRRPLVVLLGNYGTGANEIAEALCAQLDRQLLDIDLEHARAFGEPAHKALHSALLEQRLEGCGIFLRGCEALFSAEGPPTADARAIIGVLAAAPGPVILSFAPEARWRDLLRGIRKLVFALEDPDYNERRRIWRFIGGDAVPPRVADDLAGRFVLSPGQVRDAIENAADLHRLNEGASGALRAEELTEGARAQSDQTLGKLATRVRSTHTWADLVLPGVTVRLVKDVAAAIRYRHQVFSTWGFDQRLISGRGLMVLFSGAAGTGKTMTAGIIARDLAVDLYKIDLSGVVSKYIGETEKNLDRIFRAALSGNAILFFDEADALFGKRSEVKDAHDRYANIEVAYLLQKMEEHDGVVILATNLSKNLDEAFSRRMHYMVEFPLPSPVQRQQLWRGMFPPQAPLADDIDFPFLADQFALPGGDIRNIVLSAAFLAAQEETAIHMRHIIPALARMMAKKGKLPSPAEFKQYHCWIHPS